MKKIRFLPFEFTRLIFIVVLFFTGIADGEAQKDLMTTGGCRLRDVGDIECAQASWSGDCADGYCSGKGYLIVKCYDDIISTYNGDMNNGRFNGQGILDMTMAGGGKQEGHFVDGVLHGLGILWYKEGSVILKFVGRFDKGKVAPGDATVYIKDGTIVEAYFFDTKKAKGKIKYAEGDIYDGDIYGFLSDGYGKLVRKNGMVYEGNWLKGEKDGIGTLYYPNGSKYYGIFKSDTYHGTGAISFKNGIKITGDFVQGKPVGKFTFTYPDGKNEYIEDTSWEIINNMLRDYEYKTNPTTVASSDGQALGGMMLLFLLGLAINADDSGSTSQSADEYNERERSVKESNYMREKRAIRDKYGEGSPTYLEKSRDLQSKYGFSW